jgi:DNA-binding IscR family transcriptional regulator
MTCSRSGHCMVNFMWVKVRDAIAGALDSMTLADLVPPAARLLPDFPNSPPQGAFEPS